jgi:hypothetical protein
LLSFLILSLFVLQDLPQESTARQKVSIFSLMENKKYNIKERNKPQGRLYKVAQNHLLIFLYYFIQIIQLRQKNIHELRWFPFLMTMRTSFFINEMVEKADHLKL